MNEGILLENSSSAITTSILPAMYDFLFISAGFSSDMIAYFLATLFIFLIFLALTSYLRCGS